MAGLFQLRTYTLKTAHAAASYAPLWIRHKKSLEAYNVKTLGVFISQPGAQKVIALVQFQPGDDPETIMRAYAGSEQFKKDMEGVDKSQFEGIDGVVLDEAKLATQ